MKCPYCVSTIDDEAVVCPQCTRELFVVKPLLEKIAALEETLKGLQTQVGDPAGVGLPAAPLALAAEARPSPAARIGEAALLWLTPLVLLLVAHAMITVVYDLNNVVLRLVSLLLPLPFAYVLTSRRDRAIGPWLAVAFLVALLAVLGMSGITAWVDHTGIWPADRREWKEFIEYAASVGFSSITGMVLGRMAWRRQAARSAVEVRGLALRIAHLLNTGQQSAEKLQGTVKRLNELGASLTAAATSLASAYMGLQSSLGGG